ncbi:MAG TPA: glycosyltransferase family A protein [Allosphingosinicella sp.]|jgi:glycosyltransferase involved in cell wall biosynthesis
MSTPPLSVAMPVRDALPYLDESIASILGQSFADFEFTIYDDSSVDGSSERLRQWAARDSRIRLVRGEAPLGPARSAQSAVEMSRAPLIARMDADDISNPGRLGRQLELFRNHPDAVLAAALSEGIDGAGRSVRPVDAWRLARNAPFAPFAHSSIMFRRDAFMAVGGYRAEADYWEDLDFLYRMAGRGRLLVVPETLSKVRHSRSSARLREECDRVENAVDTMYRAAAAFRAGEDYEPLLRRRRAPGEKLDPRTFVGRGSTLLWSGERPRMLGRLLRRGDLGANVSSLNALVWGVVGELSPHALRLAIRTALRLGNLAARRRLAGRDAVEWDPRAGSGKDRA